MSHEDSDEQREALGDVFKPGDQVEVLSGQFEGTEAIYKEADGELRSILLVNLISRQVEVSTENKALRKK